MVTRILIIVSLCFSAISVPFVNGQEKEFALKKNEPPPEDSAKNVRLKKLTDQIAVDPKNAKLLLERANIFRDLGNIDMMIADLDGAVAAEPNSIENLVSAGRMMLEVEPDRSLEIASQAVNLAKDDLGALRLRAFANSGIGQFEEALADIDTALKIQPTNAKNLALKGNLLLHLERWDEAIEFYSKSISIEPFAYSYFDRGFCYQQTNKFVESIADYTSAYQLDDSLQDAICERGLAYQNIGSFDLAIRDFEQCRKTKPENPRPSLQLAWILATCPDAKVRDGKRAIQILGDFCDPVTCRLAEPLNALAAAYAELGDFEKARTLQKRAVAMSHFAPEFHKLSTRRLKVIEDNLPIREATTPLLLLNRAANMLNREVTLEEAMSAPPDVLGLSYLEATSVLQFCSIAKKGAKVSCEVDGIPLALNESNATLVEELLKKRQKIYQEAIQKRGSAKLSPGYQSEIEGGCAEWGISNEPVLVEQSGFEIHLSQGSVRHAGVVVESTVAFRHDENISIYITGEIIGENVVFTTPVRYGLTGNAVERCTATLAPQEVVGSDWSRAFGGRAIAHYMYREYGAVVTDLKRAIALDSNDSSNWMLLCFLLATCPDDNVRNGKEAVEAALNAKKLLGEESNDVILVLFAVAYAEYGDFESAVKYQKMVIEKVDENTKPMHMERLQLFESKKPLRAEFPL